MEFFIFIFMFTFIYICIYFLMLLYYCLLWKKFIHNDFFIVFIFRAPLIILLFVLVVVIVLTSSREIVCQCSKNSVQVNEVFNLKYEVTMGSVTKGTKRKWEFLCAPPCSQVFFSSSRRDCIQIYNMYIGLVGKVY